MFSQNHHSRGKQGPSPSWDIPAFLRLLFSHKQYSNLGDWHFVQQLTAASSCMTQPHRSSAHVTMEKAALWCCCQGSAVQYASDPPLLVTLEPHREEGEMGKRHACLRVRHVQEDSRSEGLKIRRHFSRSAASELELLLLLLSPSLKGL